MRYKISGWKLKAAATQDHHFREFFGCGAKIALNVWCMLVEGDLVPPGGQIIHLLWTLYFLKAYPKQARLAQLWGVGWSNQLKDISKKFPPRNKLHRGCKDELYDVVDGELVEDADIQPCAHGRYFHKDHVN